MEWKIRETKTIRMQIDRRAVENFDWLYFWVVTALSVIGVLTIFSATRPMPGHPHSHYYIKQLVWMVIGFGTMLLMMKLDYKWFGIFAPPLFVFGLVMLVFVLFKGHMGLGAQRWVSIGGISFQPSEIFRIAFILMIARQLSMAKPPIGISKFLRMTPLVVLLPLGLLVKQPDLGTAITMGAVFLFTCLSRGMSKKLLIALFIFGIVSLPFFWDIFWHGFLKDYQRNRLVAFLDPSVDPAGIGYHLNQSKIAIGSGMLFGKGYLHGTQGPFRFLPEKHTDFIFSVFAEEWGFIGSLVLLGLYFVLLWRTLDTARKAKDDFGAMLATAVAFMFAFYLFFNIGMTMGMLPVVGIPLPFMSYGGTSLLANFIAAGLVLNVRQRRFELFY